MFDIEVKDTTMLDPDELEGLKYPHISTREELNQLEQTNIQMGIRWLTQLKNPNVLDEKLLRTFHKKLFGDVWKWAGYYRKSEKNIGVDPNFIQIELKKLLDDTRYWIEHQTFSHREIAIRFHHRLVYIHLFPNGNGRHARLWANALLIKAFGEKPIDWAAGHNLQTMSIHRQAYIGALKKADSGNYNPLLNLLRQ